MPLSEADRLFLDYIEKKCHGTRDMGRDRYGHKGVYHDYHEVKLTEAELTQILALTANDENELLLVPNSTTFGFSGPAYQILKATKDHPFTPTEFTAVAHWSQPQMPDGWDFARMVPHFASERLVAFYGLHPFSRNIGPYVY